MSIKDTLTNNSMESFAFGGKTYTRRVDNGAVVYDISAGTGGIGGITFFDQVSIFEADAANATASASIEAIKGSWQTASANSIWAGASNLIVNAETLDFLTSGNSDLELRVRASAANPTEVVVVHQDGTSGQRSITNEQAIIPLAADGTFQWKIEETGNAVLRKFFVSGKISNGSGSGSGSGGGASVTTSPDVPASASDGDLWYDESSAALYVYTDSINGWVQANGGGGGGSGPRAYVAFDGTSSNLTGSITNSFNVSSLVDKGVGWYEVNYTTPVNNPVPTTTVESPSSTNPHDSSVYNVTANGLEMIVGFTALNNSGRHDRTGVFLVVH